MTVETTYIIRGVNEVSPVLRDIQGEARAMGGSGLFSSFVSSAQSAGRAIGGALLGGLAAIGTGLAATAAEGWRFNDSLEQTEARLFAFLKDGEAVTNMLEMITDRAAKTPFAFEEMASSVAALLPAAKQSGTEIERLIEMAEILAASNPEQGLEGAAFSLKEALGGDFASIIERFNLSRSYIKQLSQEGVPALEAVSMAMQQMGLDSDLVTGLADTMTGRWSTLSDTFTSFAGKLTKPVFEIVSAGLGWLNTKLEKLSPVLNFTANAIGDFFASLVNGEDFVESLLQVVTRLGKSFGASKDDIKELRVSIAQFVNTIKNFGVEVLRVTEPLRKFISDNFDLESALLGVGGLLTSVVVPAITKLAIAFGSSLAVLAIMSTAMSYLKRLIGQFAPEIEIVASAIGNFVSNIMMGEGVLDSLFTAISKIGKSFGFTGEEISSVNNYILSFIERVKSFGAGVAESASKVIERIKTFATELANSASKVIGFISDNFELKDVLLAIGAILISTVLPAIASFIGSIAAGIAIVAIASKAVEYLREVFTKFRPQIEAVATTILNFFKSLAEGDSFIDSLLTAIASLGTEFGYSITEIKGVNDAIVEFIDKAKTFGTELMAIIDPIVEFITKNVELEDVLTAIGVLIVGVIAPAVGSFALTLATVVGVVALVLAGVTILRNAWEENFGGIRDFTSEFVTGLKALFSGDWTGAQESEDTLKGMVLESISGMLTGIWETISNYDYAALWERLQTATTDALANLGINALISLTEFIASVTAWFDAQDWYAIGYKVTTFLIEGLKTLLIDAPIALGEFFTSVSSWFGEKDWADLMATAISKMTVALEELPQKALVELAGFYLAFSTWFQDQDWKSLATNVILGLINGLSEGMASVIAAAQDIASGITNAIADAWDSHSPSRVAIALSGDFVDGTTIGLEQNAQKPADVAGEMARNITGNVAEQMNQSNRAMVSANSPMPTVNATQASPASSQTGGQTPVSVLVDMTNAVIYGVSDLENLITDAVNKALDGVSRQSSLAGRVRYANG